MIKVFRRIRRKLLTENNFTKYLFYAIGEILLVVIGILMALYINAWNEGRKQDIVEKAFISGIKADLIQDKNYMHVVIKQSERKDSLYSILSKKILEQYDTNRPLMDSLIRDFFASQRTFYPISGSFQSAIFGNEFGRFKNRDFSNTVMKLYNSTYPRIMDNGKSVDERWFYLTRKYGYIRRTGKMPDMNLSERMIFLNDIYDYMYGVNYTKDNLAAAKQEIETLLNEY